MQCATRQILPIHTTPRKNGIRRSLTLIAFSASLLFGATAMASTMAGSAKDSCLTEAQIRFEKL
jgi:hypothetical protein